MEKIMYIKFGMSHFPTAILELNSICGIELAYYEPQKKYGIKIKTKYGSEHNFPFENGKISRMCYIFTVMLWMGTINVDTDVQSILIDPTHLSSDENMVKNASEFAAKHGLLSSTANIEVADIAERIVPEKPIKKGKPIKFIKPQVLPKDMVSTPLDAPQ